ncbi:hypothetical protein EW145_g1912 [Phellinidium pouzarii]|uniref:Peptidase A1 domain-containing protein n=1 Tax=Phellinidium pouzarii TaxID=167371 RepID=A0A4S4LD00_9AGAM|nr:hypothetical protein EW145_g1912 [Phellinidium pouzarii]
MSPRRPTLLALACVAAVASVAVNALSVPFSRVSGASSRSSKDTSSNLFDFQNSNNASSADIYVATLSVAGQDFVIQLDTGSSDLWLDTAGIDLSSLTQTGYETGLSYSDGTVAEGPLYVGNVTFGNFTVNQAFISAPGTNATTNQDRGLLGVGPPLLSTVQSALANTIYNGDTLMNNVLDSDPSLPKFTTFSLSRSFATGKTDGGTFTIGEVNSSFSAITSNPQLDVVSKDRWIVLMDNIIVNGRNVSGGSSFSVSGQSSGQTLACLDTGTTLAQIPRTYADAIYGPVPGSILQESAGIYAVPCDAKINVTFVFAGMEFPVHPIDTVTATTDDNGNIVCYSGFPFSDGSDSSEDFLLGDSFLRNVYSLYDYGSFFNESASPFIQLLATTNADQAYPEFDSLSAQRNQSLLSSRSSSGSSPGGTGSGSSSASPSRTSKLGAMSILLAFGLLII